MKRRHPTSTRTSNLFPYATVFRSSVDGLVAAIAYLECQVGVFKVSRNVFLAETADSAPQFQGQHHARAGQIVGLTGVVEAWIVGVGIRSEEHTSELQSLMRISYAVFCLKKKISHTITNNIPH